MNQDLHLNCDIRRTVTISMSARSTINDVNVQLDKKSDVESCTYLSQRTDAVIASEWVDVERVIVSIDVLGELPKNLWKNGKTCGPFPLKQM